MQTLVFRTSDNPLAEILLVDLLDELKTQEGITFEEKERNISPRTIEGIIIAFLSSSALVVFASAIRDLSKKKKISLELKNEKGQSAILKAEGDDLGDVADIVGYLTNNNTKHTIEEIRSMSIDNPIKIEFKLNDLE